MINMKKNLMPILLISSIVIINIVSALVLRELNIITLIASIIGVTSVVMSTKGPLTRFELIRVR